MEKKLQFFTDFSKVQQEMPIIGKNKSGRFRYADYAEIIYVSFPILTKYGFSVMQPPVRHEDGSMSIKTMLIHSAGHVEESLLPVPLPVLEEYKGKQSFIQAYMSNVTYVRRYALCSMLSLAISDEDYDGDYEAPRQQPLVKDEPISKEQLEQLEIKLNGYPDLIEKIYHGLHITRLSDMPKSKFISSLARIEELKRMRAGIK